VSPRFSPSELFLNAQTDERLAALASEGHGRAFAVLIGRQRGPLMAHARRLVGTERAEDVVQEALLRAWRALERGAEVRHVQAWLHRIVHNTALNEIERQVPAVEPLHEQLADPRSAAQTAEQRLQVRDVLVSVATLPERQRLALLGMELEGRSRRQLAAELGLSEGAVRQLVHRARDGVRAAMAAFVPFPVVTRVMKASGWLQGADSSPALHPAAEATAASGLAAGAVIKAGTAVLAVGALGGGLLVHAGHGPKHARRAATPHRTLLRDAHPAGRVRSGAAVAAAPGRFPVAAVTGVTLHRAEPAATRSSTAGVPDPAQPEQVTSIAQRPSARPPQNQGRPAAERQTSGSGGDSSGSTPDPSRSGPGGGTGTSSPSSGDSQPSSPSSGDSQPSGTPAASSSQDYSSQTSTDATNTPNPSDSSGGQSSSDASSSAGTTTSSSTGD
jgi:RNA polymerase sigma factor (sigma-70 family)